MALILDGDSRGVNTEYTRRALAEIEGVPKEISDIGMMYILPIEFLKKIPSNLESYVDNPVRGNITFRNGVDVGLAEEFVVSGHIDTENRDYRSQVNLSDEYADTVCTPVPRVKDQIPEPAVFYIDDLVAREKVLELR